MGEAGAPSEFFIDSGIYVSCGLCAKVCPFDAIMMDHDNEVAPYERYESSIWGVDKLSRPHSCGVQRHLSGYPEGAF